MNRSFHILAGAALATTLAFGAAAQDTLTKSTVVATVDGTDLTLGHVVALRGRLPERYQQLTDDVLFPAIVDQLIQQVVLMDNIKNEMDTRLELSLENEMRAFLASEMMARLSERVISEEDLQAAYTERYDSVVPAQEYDASHILVKTEAEALELVSILNDGADFAETAREKSTGPSGPSGGSLGWFGKGAMVPEFEAAVTALAVNEISAPVQTQFGWHVIRLNDLRDLPVPTLDEIRPRLIAEMQQTGLQNELQRLTEAAEITRSYEGIDPAVIRDVSLFKE